MRIVQLVTKPQRRGAETFALQLAHALERRGHTCHVVALYRHEEPGPALALRPHDVALQADEHAAVERIVSPSLYRALWSTLRRLQPDLVQANGGRALKYAPLLKASSASPHARYVYRNIDRPSFWLRGRLARAALPRLVRHTFDGVVCISAATRAEVLDVYAPRGRVATIANGVDFTSLAGPPRTRHELGLDDRPLLAWCGSVSAQKRPERFVELLAALPGVQGLVVGGGPLLPQLQALARARGVDTRLAFTGVVDGVGPYLRLADVFVMTSDTEGVPAVLLEAAYLGLPIVAPDVGGVAASVHDDASIVVPAGDHPALVRAARAFLDDAARRDRAGDSARAFAAAFDIDVIAQRYADFYEELCAAPPI